MEIGIDIHVPPGVTPQPANHFVVSYTDDDFALDITYIHPFDLHVARQKPEAERRVRGTMVGRIALSYRHAVELRAKLDEMIKSYEVQKK
jgi:hypothetical protein